MIDDYAIVSIGAETEMPARAAAAARMVSVPGISAFWSDAAAGMRVSGEIIRPDRQPHLAGKRLVELGNDLCTEATGFDGPCTTSAHPPADRITSYSAASCSGASQRRSSRAVSQPCAASRSAASIEGPAMVPQGDDDQIAALAPQPCLAGRLGGARSSV
jgi:hypothetical protein